VALAAKKNFCSGRPTALGNHHGVHPPELAFDPGAAAAGELHGIAQIAAAGQGQGDAAVGTDVKQITACAGITADMDWKAFGTDFNPVQRFDRGFRFLEKERQLAEHGESLRK
jgi:hypothetical protein